MKYWVLSVICATTSLAQQQEAELQRRIWEMQLEQMKSGAVQKEIAERKSAEAELKEFFRRVKDYADAFNAYMQSRQNGTYSLDLKKKMLKAQRRMEDHSAW
jgi:anthranilate phosphoribosyltransferase